MPTPRSLFDLPQKFQDKIMPCPTTGCWLWTGAGTKGGYGIIGKCVNGRQTCACAHREVYSILVCPVDPSLEIDHLCRNTRCCNPIHLEPVTPKVNQHRGLYTSAAKEKCKRGHPFDEVNTRYTKKGARFCRECMRMHGRNAYRRRDKDEWNERQRRYYRNRMDRRTAQPPTERP